VRRGQGARGGDHPAPRALDAGVQLLPVEGRLHRRQPRRPAGGATLALRAERPSLEGAGEEALETQRELRLDALAANGRDRELDARRVGLVPVACADEGADSGARQRAEHDADPDGRKGDRARIALAQAQARVPEEHTAHEAADDRAWERVATVAAAPLEPRQVASRYRPGLAVWKRDHDLVLARREQSAFDAALRDTRRRHAHERPRGQRLGLTGVGRAGKATQVRQRDQEPQSVSHAIPSCKYLKRLEIARFINAFRATGIRRRGGIRDEAEAVRSQGCGVSLSMTTPCGETFAS